MSRLVRNRDRAAALYQELVLDLVEAWHRRELELGFIFLVGDELKIGIIENATGVMAYFDPIFGRRTPP